MPEQIRKQRPARSVEPEPHEASQGEVDESAEEALRATDDLLDEIDEVLESNASEFLANYVQQGGQ